MTRLHFELSLTYRHHRSLIREQIEREINGHGMEVDEEDGMEAEEQL